ncbi:hypothetical protein EJ02DRAFT_493708 [Clathrospora elynae]|uniref:Uncharacterized protein n=1 Tax=Clathrospora elynae TaxID=706981 RepID=A0A6A5T776_9PLEO|nr:hypothetical protein EJ02DRAFT_493708 [Clathrospora elynae]
MITSSVAIPVYNFSKMAEPDYDGSAGASYAFNSLSVLLLQTTAFSCVTALSDITVFPAANMDIGIRRKASKPSKASKFSEEVQTPLTHEGEVGTAKRKIRSDSLMDELATTNKSVQQPEHDQSHTTTAAPAPGSGTRHIYESTLNKASTFFNADVSGFVANNVDFNRIGILYQYAHMCYIIAVVPHPQNGKPNTRRAWVKLQDVGTYLRLEWIPLSKIQVGRHGCGATNESPGWASHSKLIQQLRLACLLRAQEIHAIMWLKNEGKEMNMAQYTSVLEAHLAEVVDGVYGTVVTRNAQVAKEADVFMEEFMVFEE